MSTAKKFVSGKVTKRVDCAGCGRSYEYDLSRTVMGSSSKQAATQSAAEAEALEDANTKLKAALANDCDPVCCPSCGALTKEMKTYRWKRFGWGFACLGMGAGVLLLELLLALFLHRILIVVGLLGAGCLLLGLAVLGIGIMDLLAPKKGRA
jgi:hypothetical protein